MQVEVQKRARSACTTFKALKSEWDEVRGEAQDDYFDPYTDTYEDPYAQ